MLSCNSALISISNFSSQSDDCILRFYCSSVEEAYELLFEILKPISSELNGLYPYKDRCLPNVNNYSFDHPISILRNL